MNKITITALKSYEEMSTSERISAALCIRNLLHGGNQHALQRLKEICADRGDAITFETYANTIEVPPCLFAKIERLEPVVSEHERCQAELHRLLIEGARGDFGAAVEYCRAELAGEVNHAACAAG